MRWTVRQILRLRDRAPRLVVLSTRSSVAGLPAGRFGRLSLARAVLVAGSETILAAIRPVDDRLTAILMSNLYQRMAEGLSPESALVRVERDGMGMSNRSPSNPASAFEALARARRD